MQIVSFAQFETAFSSLLEECTPFAEEEHGDDDDRWTNLKKRLLIPLVMSVWSKERKPDTPGSG